MQEEKNTNSEELKNEEELQEQQEQQLEDKKSEAQEQELEEQDETGEEEEQDEAARQKRKRGARGGSKKKGVTEEEYEKVQEELAEMKDKYLRLYAEFDNYRRRTLKEREHLSKTATQKAMEVILPTIDDFERAVRASKESQGEAVPEGIVLIFEKMIRSLDQFGLKAMESTDMPFDADLHEAVTTVPAPTEDMKGKVLDTVEKGYYLQDKIIRYAKVVVAQ